MFIILTRLRSVTEYPKYSHIRLIWRFKPCVRIILNSFFDTCVTLQGFVTVSSMGTPEAIPFRNSGVTSLLTFTMYSFSWLLPERSILFTISPSFVRSNSPSESLSRRPIGNTLLPYFRKSMTLSGSDVSVVQTIPRGLFNAMSTSLSSLFSTFPSTAITFSAVTVAPISAFTPSMVTRPWAISSSAPRREQMPESASALLILMLSRSPFSKKFLFLDLAAIAFLCP